jgi:general secretion pathway protein I
MPTPWNSKGFTLIEIMVAMAVLGVCLVTIMQLFSGGLRSSKVSNDYTRAAIRAKEKMEEILLNNEFSEGSFSGDFADGFRWRVDVAQFKIVEEGMPTVPVDLFEIRVGVLWNDGNREKHFDISTLRTGTKIETEG